MKRILHWLNRLVNSGGQRGSQGSFPLPAVPLCGDWTETDKRLLASILDSDFGKRLWSRFRAAEYQIYQERCGDFMHTTHSAGLARGFTDARLWLESLSRSIRVPMENDSPEQQTGAPDMPQQGEADLHERYSP